MAARRILASMTFRFAAAIFTALVLPIAVRASDSFFPIRPANVPTSTAVGILTDFGIGNALGSFTLRDSGGTREYYVGAKTLLEGRAIACTAAPTASFTPSKDECTYWPKDIVLGTTRVRMTYWTTVRPDTNERVRVAQSLDPVPGSGSLDASIASARSLGVLAGSGNAGAFRKLFDGFARSDGAVAESFADAIARASTKSPSVALATLASAPVRSQNQLANDPDIVCEDGAAHAFASVRAASGAARSLQKKIAALCASPRANAQTP